MIVYTSGVFDLFHAGHIDALKNAADLGNKLIVGVLSDEDAASYKRKPVIPYEQRFLIIQSLRFVDQIIPGPKYETVAFYRSFNIDIHCQGNEIQGFYTAAKQLGILKIIGRSHLNETSNIIEAIKAS